MLLGHISIILMLAAGAIAGETRVELEYAPAPVDNPLKGLVPYAGEGKDRFPHSLEFNYLPLSALMKDAKQIDWQPLDKLLDDIASRGHQAVVRIFLEYPGRKDGIPKFLIDGGLKTQRWIHDDGSPKSEVTTPDYENPQLRETLKFFIAELGKRYDGDARLGFITAGLLGLWGEWHTYPREKLFASKTVQAEVMDAYAAAFKTTPVLLRYPAGASDEEHAPNHARNFGYHDDSFAWATLETGKKNDSWFYMAALRAAGPEALDKWKRCPIGGEIRPEAWGVVFDENHGNKKIQDFAKCVEATHATWLMDSGMFKKDVPAARRQRAEEQVRKMGYEFHVAAVTTEIKDDALRVRIEVINKGVAPFYYDWKPEIALAGADGKVVLSAKSSGSLKGLLPGEPARIWNDALEIKSLPSGTYKLLLRVPNPMPKGKPLRFANKTQASDAESWLTLTSISK